MQRRQLEGNRKQLCKSTRRRRGLLVLDFVYYKFCFNCLTRFEFLYNQGRTLLHWACDRSHIDIVNYLINKNHQVNCVDKELLTPLHYGMLTNFSLIAKY